MLNEIEAAIKNAEDNMGFKVPTDIAEHILGYTIRKFLNIVSKEEKPEGYLGILYQNEIEDYYRRKAISSISSICGREKAYV